MNILERENFLASLPASANRNSALCALLSSENISIKYESVKTASFNTVSRVLTIPMWKNISMAVLDRLIIHEVGHALETRNWVELSMASSSTVINAANIIEDRRVDNAMKKRYPGVAKDYALAAKEMVKMNIFDIQQVIINELGFLDRANLLSKIGHNKEIINFSSVEKGWLAEIEAVKSTEEAFKLAEKILRLIKEEKKRQAEEKRKQEEKKKEEEKKETEEKRELEEKKESEPEASGESESEEKEEKEEKETQEEPETTEEEPKETEETEEPEATEEATEEPEENVESLGTEKTEEGDSEETEEGEGEDDSEESEEGSESEEEEEGESTESGADGASDGPTDNGEIDDSEEIEDEEILSSDFFENVSDSIETINGYLDMRKDIAIDPYQYIISLEEMRKMGQFKEESNWSRYDAEYKKKIKKEALQLFKEFSVRKEALVQNVFYSDRGSLDMNRLSEYRTNDQIFVQGMKRVSRDDNHKFYFLVDYSGSMSGGNLRFACHQVAVFREFCVMANAEFSVYLFATNFTEIIPKKMQERKEVGQYVENHVRLVEISNNKQSEKEFWISLTKTERVCFRGMGSGSTPLFDSCKIVRSLMEIDKARTPDKKLNFILLTDGQESWSNSCDILEGTDRLQYTTKSRCKFLIQLEMMKKVAHSVTGFALATGYAIGDFIRMHQLTRYNGDDVYGMQKEIKSKFNREGFINIDVQGFDDMWILKNLDEGEDLKRTVERMESDASASAFKNAYLKNTKASGIRKIITKKMSERIS